jgi:hypothetical protein
VIAARRKQESENKKTLTENRTWDGENEQQRGRLVDRSSVEREENAREEKEKSGPQLPDLLRGQTRKSFIRTQV